MPRFTFLMACLGLGLLHFSDWRRGSAVEALELAAAQLEEQLQQVTAKAGVQALAPGQVPEVAATSPLSGQSPDAAISGMSGQAAPPAAWPSGGMPGL